MDIQDIFLAAIEIEDLQKRAAYVAQACGGDQELLRKAHALLTAHERSGDFLDIPALQQIADGKPRERKAAEHQSLRDEIDLSFLKPSSRPGSLGRLLHYEVLEIVGRGGCGIVLKAFDVKLHRVVAIKMMTPELAVTSPARKRFLREARTTAAIRHDNVVSIYAVEEKPFPFLVMEFIDGQTLQDKINETGPLDIQDVLSIGRQIARGLEAAHAQGLIHRDIKPANILLESGSGRPKITDFGLARSADDASLTQSGAISGTPLYMSPEQAQGLEVDHRSDLFSLGSVLYVMCSGRPPFRAATAVAVLKRVVEEQPRPIREIIPETPRWLVSVIAKLHAKKPQGRFSSIHEVVEALEHQESEPAVTRMVQRISPSESASLFTARLMCWLTGPKRRRWAIPSVVMAALLIGLGLWNLTGSVNLPQTSRQSRLPDGNPPSAEAVSEPTFSSSATSNPNSGSQPVISNGADDPLVGTWKMLMGPWPYTATFQANGTGEGRFHPDVLKAIKNKNNGGGPPETFPMTWEKIAAGKYSITMLGVTSPDFVLNGDRLTCPRWEHPGERLSRSTLPADPNRKAAEYVFAHDGIIRIQGSDRDIRRSDPFPESPFSLSSVSLTGRKAVGDEQLNVFADCKYINALWLSQTSVSDRGLACFQQCRDLKSLDISQTKVTGPGLAHFANCRNLEYVSVWFTRIPLKDFLPLADKPFKHLNFGGNSAFSDEWLSHFTHLENLELLNLRYTDVSNEGLAPLRQYRNLKYLSLGNTKVTDAGLDDLQNCTELEDVLLTETNVTDAGVKLFANCKKLKNLELEKTKVTAAGIEELRRSLPQCRIVWDGGVIEPGKP
jgi:serine/threonine protein kinase